MTKLRKKIEKIFIKGGMIHEHPIEEMVSLCKKYALSVLPKEKKVKFNTDIGFNQAIKQSKQSIKEKEE